MKVCDPGKAWIPETRHRAADLAGMEHSNKNQLLYEEYLSEVNEMRKTCISSIDGANCDEIR